ncbi:MAG TPA: hypothetical protein VGB37_01435 [Candidatus Lokiarchaeia archaeon]
MALIDNDHEVVNESSATTWQDELNNCKILLNEVNKGILTLIQSNHSSYELNTGQSSQSVRRLSLLELKDMRSELMFQINEFELVLGIKPICRQVIPEW